MPSRPHFAVTEYDLTSVSPRHGHVVHVDAGNRGKERIVPPAGEDYAFERQLWARRVEVYVSPTGRSVRVFVDGVEIVKKSKKAR